MRRRRGGLNLFFGGELSAYFDSIRSGLRATVQGEKADYLLGVNEEEYVDHLVNSLSVEPLEIHFDDMYATTSEKMISSDRFPGGGFDFFLKPGGSYAKQVFRYHIPYSGTEDLLRYTPNPRLMSSPAVDLEEGCICFDVIDFYSDPDRVKQDADRVVSTISQQFENVQKNVASFNDQLSGHAKKFFDERKVQLQKQGDVASALGVPIRMSDSVPETFRVPTTRRKVVPKPSAPSGTENPEPALGDDIYEEILQVIHDTGKVFERLPSTYSDKDEEALRDHLILALEPRFEGSTAGETFNKSGKTDILMRHEKSNIFVAECQWWHGAKMHSNKIDQLLGYLTWRDSKAAIVCFADRKDFSNSLKQIVDATQSHALCVSYVGAKDETWHNFEFHLPGDPGRKLKLAVLAFHMPR